MSSLSVCGAGRDEEDVESNGQNSGLGHLHNVVSYFLL